MGGHPPAPLDLVLVDPPRPLGGRIGPQLVERPGEVDGGGTSRGEHAVRLVEVLAPRRGERVAVRRGDADRRRAADGQRPDRRGDLGRGAALELDLLVRQAPLVEEDDAVLLEPRDPLGGQVACRDMSQYLARARYWDASRRG